MPNQSHRCTTEAGIMGKSLPVIVDFWHARRADRKEILSKVEEILKTSPPTGEWQNKVKGATIYVCADGKNAVHYSIHYHMVIPNISNISQYKSVKAEELAEKSV